jgi:hypothetical protein
MSAEIDIDVFQGTDPIWTIAEEVFTAMIDGEPGYLRLWDGPVPTLADERYAWVDVHGAQAGRILLTSELPTVEHLTRALLGMDEAEAVSDADLVDALGEVANVVGGNVKALVPDPGVLTLPEVTHERPSTEGQDLLYELALDWRGRILLISLWKLP